VENVGGGAVNLGVVSASPQCGDSLGEVMMGWVAACDWGEVVMVWVVPCDWGEAVMVWGR